MVGQHTGGARGIPGRTGTHHCQCQRRASLFSEELVPHSPHATFTIHTLAFHINSSQGTSNMTYAYGSGGLIHGMPHWRVWY